MRAMRRAPAEQAISQELAAKRAAAAFAEDEPTTVGRQLISGQPVTEPPSEPTFYKPTTEEPNNDESSDGAQEVLVQLDDDEASEVVMVEVETDDVREDRPAAAAVPPRPPVAPTRQTSTQLKRAVPVPVTPRHTTASPTAPSAWQRALNWFKKFQRAAAPQPPENEWDDDEPAMAFRKRADGGLERVSWAEAHERRVVPKK